MEVEKLIATYEADTRKFQQGMRDVDIAILKSQSAILKLNKSLEKFERPPSVAPLTKNIGQVSQRFNSARSAAESFWKSAAATTAGHLAATALQRIGAILIDVGKRAIDSAASFDALERGLSAIAGSTDAAQKQLVRLREVAKLPGLGFREAIQGSIRLQAVGFSAEMAERSLRAFGNAVAFTGGGKSELDRITVQLGQMSGKSKILAQDLRPIIESAPAVGKALKDAFGTVDTEQLQQLGLTNAQFLDKLLTQLEKLPPAANGAKNAMENFGDTIDVAFATIGKPLLEPLTRALDSLTPIIANVAQSVANSFPAIATEVKSIFGSLPPVVQETFQNILGTVQSLGAGVVNWFKTNYPLIKQTIVTVLTAIANFWQSHGEQIKAVVGGYLRALGQIISGVMSAINGDWEGAWSKLGSALKNILSAAWNSIKFLFSTWVGGLKTIGSELYEAAKGLGRAIARGIWEGVKEGIASFFDIRGAIQAKIDQATALARSAAQKAAEGAAEAGLKSHATFRRLKDDLLAVAESLDKLTEKTAKAFGTRERVVGGSAIESAQQRVAEALQRQVEFLRELRGETELEAINRLLSDPSIARMVDTRTAALLRFNAALRDNATITRPRRYYPTERPRRVGDAPDDGLELTSGDETRPRRVFGPSDEEIAAYNERISGMARYASDVLVDAFRAGFDKGLKGFLQSLLQSLTNYLDSVLRQVLDRMFEDIFRRAGSQSGGGGGFGGGFGGIFNSIVSAIAGIFSGGGGSAATATAGMSGGLAAFGGGRASGGPVKGGWLYRVNENDTEYFQPKTDGHIYNKSQMGGTTIIKHYHFETNHRAPISVNQPRSSREIANNLVTLLKTVA